MNIKSLIGETTEYEKKVALETRKPKSWLKSVSAFANGKGGILIFGVDDNDNIVGLTDAKKDSETISEQIKTRMNPIPEFNLRIERVESEKIIVILDVSEGKQTPYYYDADGVMQSFVRIGNQSVLATAMQLKELVLKGTSTSYDSLVSPYNFEDMSFTKLKSVYKQRTGTSFVESDYESFGIIDEKGNLTNAGALLADESPVRHSRLFYTRWNGLDKAPGIIDAVDDEEYSGGLVNLLLDGMGFVDRNSKKAWRKTEDGRIEMPEYPKRAVMEGLVNALIHRNYLEIGSEVHIDMFDDHMEIYSPGGMCDGSIVQEENILEIPSRRRNPVIADIFHRLKYMDRRESGFKKILGDYEFQDGYREELKPEFYSNNGTFKLTLKNMNYKKEALSSGDKNRQEKTAKKNRQEKSPRNISKLQKHMEAIDEFLMKNGPSKVSDIAEAIGLSERRTREILNLMDGVKSSEVQKGRTYWL